MVEKIYRCNLCREQIDPKNKNFGVKWGTGNRLEFCNPITSENHLCGDCAEDIHENYQQVLRNQEEDKVEK